MLGFFVWPERGFVYRGVVVLGTGILYGIVQTLGP